MLRELPKSCPEFTLQRAFDRGKLKLEFRTINTRIRLI